jgi:hypothetical protein
MNWRKGELDFPQSLTAGEVKEECAAAGPHQRNRSRFNFNHFSAD